MLNKILTERERNEEDAEQWPEKTKRVGNKIESKKIMIINKKEIKHNQKEC